MKNDVILYRCYEWNDFIESQCRTLVENCPYTVNILQDITNNEPIKTDVCPVWTFNVEDYKKSGYPLATDFQLQAFGTPPNNDSKYIYHNTEYAVLFYANQHRNFDNYWCWEFDLMYNGDYDYFWDRCDDSIADLLAIYLTPYISPHNIKWLPDTHIVPDDRRFRMFGALWRANHKMLNALHIFLKKGFHNNTEQLIPTVGAMCDLYMKEFNSLPDYRMLYSVDTLNFNRDLPPVMYLPEGNQNKLFHPIKTEHDLHTRIYNQQ